MLTILVAFIIGVVLTVISMLKETETDFVTPAVLIGILVAGVIGMSKPTERYVSKEYTIKAIHDNITSEAHFTLGTGTLNGKAKYFFYKQTGNGYVLGNIDTDNTLIIESESQPSVKEYRQQAVNKTKWGIGQLSFSDGREITVPKSTIISNYVLDAK